MSDDTDWALVDFDEPPKPPPKPMPMPKPGYCRICGKHIGRGVAFHEKRCHG